METRTVLFVDDERDILNALKKMMRKEPYRSLFAQSGQEALGLLEKESIQVIVTDLNMPGMSGLTLLGRIEQKFPHTIRLALTGHGDKKSVLDAINEGHVYRYILKPWDDEELKIIVRQAIELQQERRRLELLADLVESARHVMIFIVYPDGRIAECNALARSTFGYSKSEMLTRTVDGLFKLGADEGWEKIAAVVEHELHWRAELVGVCKDGTQLPVDLAASRTESEEARSTHIICFGRDLSRDKEIDFMKAEFVSVASHEIRTPLTSIKNAMDLVMAGKTGTLNQGQEKFLSLAKRNIDRLCAIVHHMFDIFQMESEKMALQIAQMDIADCIGNVIDAFKPLADEKSISLEMFIDPDIPRVYADGHRINEVIGNLVGNAIKYTPENGTVTIAACQIKALPDTANGAAGALVHGPSSMVSPFVEVSVTDNGIGIPDEFVDHIFDKFRQVELSLSTADRTGMGLGLAICKYTVEAHGGRIWCKSKKGDGSTFCFTLPISPERGTKEQIQNREIRDKERK